MQKEDILVEFITSIHWLTWEQFINPFVFYCCLYSIIGVETEDNSNHLNLIESLRLNFDCCLVIFFLLFTVTYASFFSVFYTRDKSFQRKILFLIHKRDWISLLLCFYFFLSPCLVLLLFGGVLILSLGVLSLFPCSPKKKSLMNWISMKINKRIFTYFHCDILSIIVPW